jgi:hypothetical protein
MYEMTGLEEQVVEWCAKHDQPISSSPLDYLESWDATNKHPIYKPISLSTMKKSRQLERQRDMQKSIQLERQGAYYS